MTQNVWQEMKTNHAIGGLAIAILGIVATIFLWWFFGGFGFWEIPGLAILMIGIAEILYVFYKARTGRKSTLLHVGLPLLFLGVACYLSFAPHVILGTVQILSMVAIVMGIVLAAIGLFTSRRT